MEKTTPVSLSQLLRNTGSIRRYVAPYLKHDNSTIALMCVLLVAITIANTAMIWLLGSSINYLTNSAFDQLTDTLIWLAAIVVINRQLVFVDTRLALRQEVEVLVINGKLPAKTARSCA